MISSRYLGLGYVLRMKDDILPSIVLVGQASRAKKKSRSSSVKVGEYRKERNKGKREFPGKVKEGSFK